METEITVQKNKRKYEDQSKYTKEARMEKFQEDWNGLLLCL